MAEREGWTCGETFVGEASVVGGDGCTVELAKLDGWIVRLRGSGWIGWVDRGTGAVLESEDSNVADIGCCLPTMMSCPNQERGWHYCPSLHELLDLQCIDSRGRDYFGRC